MTNTKLWPPYKDAAAILAESQDRATIISHADLADMLDTSTSAPAYWQGVAQLRELLVKEYGLCLVSVRGEGYKLATEAEKVKVESSRLQTRMVGALKRQARTLATVDPGQLEPSEKSLFERHVIRNGLLRSAVKQTALNRIKPGKVITLAMNDMPRLVEG